MSVRSLNGLAGSSTTNVYVNTIDVFEGTLPVVVAQTSANQPVNISLKDINGFGGAGKILEINGSNNGLVWGDQNWERVASCRKPIIAAVSGYALGGGCELAMMCDFILASENAKFGQPEINLGVSPGAGGSQRLTRFVGKSKSMDMCLTGRMMDADEAERSGLVSRVFAAENFLNDVIEVAKAISDKSMIATMMTKEMVNRSYETTLSEGIRFERRLFHSMFATEDKKEGMSAFIEKRKADFKDK